MLHVFGAQFRSSLLLLVSKARFPKWYVGFVPQPPPTKDTGLRACGVSVRPGGRLPNNIHPSHKQGAHFLTIGGLCFQDEVPDSKMLTAATVQRVRSLRQVKIERSPERSVRKRSPPE